MPKKLLTAETVTVGQEVYCQDGRYDHNCFFGKVTKITPKGQIVVEREIVLPDNSKGKREYRFNKGGDEISSDSWNKRSLIDVIYARALIKMFHSRRAANRSLQDVKLLVTPSGAWDADTLLKAVDNLENKLIAAKAAILQAKTEENAFDVVQKEYK